MACQGLPRRHPEYTRPGPPAGARSQRVGATSERSTAMIEELSRSPQPPATPAVRSWRCMVGFTGSMVDC